MAHRDLREFLEFLDKKDHLLRIKTEVNWDEELGTIAEQAIMNGEKALLFENIKDHTNTKGRRVAMGHWVTSRRTALALGLEENTSNLEMLNIWRERVKSPIKPIAVSTGPCKDVILKGDDVNLFEFPAPKLHRKDGGRYFLTCHADITTDPDTGWLNLGIYRGMILSKNTIGRLLVPTQHWGIHSRKYHAMGSPMPIACALGLDPVIQMVACTPFPVGVNEFDMAGALRGEPVEVVKCETSDLYVPAHAEIVLEGEISMDPNTFQKEGPFGEYPGHYTTLWSEPRPVMKVNCITYRSDPIFTSSTVGLASVDPHGSEVVVSLGTAAEVWNQLEAYGVQGITGVWGDPGVSGWTNICVSIKKLYYGHAKQVAAALWGAGLSMGVGKFLVVVDSDVDVTNLRLINAAIANRVQGQKDVVVFPGTFGGPLDPGNSPEVKHMTGGIGNWDRVLIDATWPFEWEAREEWGGLRHPPECRAEPDMVEKVLKRWREYGFATRGDCFS